MESGEVRQTDAKELAEFFIASTWGVLSRTPKSSTKEVFLRDIEHIMIALRA